MKKKKLFLTISLAWIILIGYLVWANGLMNEGSKKFKWDEWIWFGIIPAISPYFIIYSKIIKDGKIFCAGESKIYDAENKLICSSNSLYAIKSNLKT